jgi:hypothetical protein
MSKKHTPLPWIIGMKIKEVTEREYHRINGKQYLASGDPTIPIYSIHHTKDAHSFNKMKHFSVLKDLIKCGLSLKDAAFIVKACNNHYQLFEALEWMVNTYVYNLDADGQPKAQLTEIIEKQKQITELLKSLKP